MNLKLFLVEGQSYEPDHRIIVARDAREAILTWQAAEHATDCVAYELPTKLDGFGLPRCLDRETLPITDSFNVEFK